MKKCASKSKITIKIYVKYSCLESDQEKMIILHSRNLTNFHQKMEGAEARGDIMISIFENYDQGQKPQD